MKPKRKPADFQAEIAAIAASLRAQIEAQVAGFDPDPQAQLARVARAGQRTRDGLEFFARTYFPHYVSLPNSLVHDALYERLPALLNAPRDQADALAAPRGEAKSTIAALIFPLWCVVHGWKKYPIIIMDAFDQAAIALEQIKAELESNPRLAADFPAVAGSGPTWREAVIVTRNGAKVEVFGSGKKIRGRKHGSHRPDLVILDDIENDENVRNPVQRDKLEAWIDKAVMKLGGSAKFDVLFIGTLPHHDSVLARKLKNPFWRHRSFRAVIQWPDRMDLWEAWEEVVRNDDARLIADCEERGEPLADTELPSWRVYQARRAEMDAGAVVSWPAGKPLYKLMWIRARDGHASFDSEYQNTPVAGDSAPFLGAITFWVVHDPEWLYFGAVDPSLGKHGASRDPSAIGVGGWSRRFSRLDVVEAAIRKRLPDRIIEDVIEFQRRYRCHLWVVEAVQFQEFLYTELLKRSALAGIPVPARPVTPHADKVLRIESIQPHVKNGLIRLHPSQGTLIEQLEHFPAADHDDGPDMLHMLWMAASTAGQPVAYESVGPGRRGGRGRRRR
jgi:predicted phage terminase large subunit-like protein